MWARPPRDWGDTQGWERYWREILSDPSDVDWYSIGFAGGKLLEYVKSWRQGLRLLCAGNGISLEPYALAHLGFQVVVIDVSSAACEFVRQHKPTPKMLAAFFAEGEKDKNGHLSYPRKLNLRRSLARVKREHRPGGSITVIQQDLFAYQPEEPYHFISSIRAFQGFTAEQQSRLAKLFFDWLVPSGRCFVETMNMVGHRHAIEARFIEAGFFREAPEYVEWWGEWLREEEAARGLPDQEQKIAAAQAKYQARWTEAHEETWRRLVAGEKQAIFSHASG